MTMSGMRFMRWTHLLAVVALAGCASPPVPRSIEEVAEGYVRAALQLAQHDASLVEDWRGEPAWAPGPRVPVADVARTIDALVAALAGTAGGTARHRYLAAQLGGLRFAARRLMGEPATLDEQAREEFGIELSAFEPASMAALRAAIDRVLPGPGSTADRFAALKVRTTVPGERRLAVMAIALSACRTATAPALSLPAGERVTLAVTQGLGWDGYARDAGDGQTLVEINGDGPLDVSRALRLACHEGYPGHHVQHLLIGQVGWPELGLSPGFGPHVLLAEGAAEAGADLALTAEQRAQVYREQLLPAAGLPAGEAEVLARVDEWLGGLHPVVTDVARGYLDGSLAKDRAIERLRDEALILNAAGSLALIERRRARALVYGEGRRLILERLSSRDLSSLHALFRRAIALQ